MKIIGIGNALVDVLAFLEDENTLKRFQLQRGGMELIDETRRKEIAALLDTLNPKKTTGGSAGNTILTLACLGTSPGFIGRIGNDDMGRFFAENCKARGIEARLDKGEGATGVAHTFISADGERTFATYLGEAARLDKGFLTPDLFHGYDLLHVEGYLVTDHALIEHAMRMAKSCGMKVSLDLASYNVVAQDLAFFRHLVQDYVDIVFANEEESEAFTQGKKPEEALQEIAGMCETAIVKLGKRGSIAQRDQETAHTTGSTGPVLDTTAAGDFFAGGFLYGYGTGWSLQQCLEAGALLSSQVIQVIGTQVPQDKWEDIRQKLEKREER